MTKNSEQTTVAETASAAVVDDQPTISKKELTGMCFNVGAMGMEWSWNYPDR